MHIDPQLVLLDADENFGRLIAFLIIALVSWLGSLLKKRLDKKALENLPPPHEVPDETSLVEAEEEVQLEDVSEFEVVLPRSGRPPATTTPPPPPPSVVTARPVSAEPPHPPPQPLGLPAHRPSTIPISPMPLPRLAVVEAPSQHAYQAPRDVERLARVDAKSGLTASAGSLTRRIESVQLTQAPVSTHPSLATVLAALRQARADGGASLRQAIIWSEVLGPPAAFRDTQGRPGD